MSTHYDVVIIGSGAGGGTIAHALSDTGKRILIVERGGFVEQEPENWSPEAVWKARRYRPRNEFWVDATRPQRRLFRPYTHYGVGGNTKFWGSALYRLRREDFQAVEHEDGISPAWPIDYEELAPYYDRAERLYHVHGATGDDPTEPPRNPYPFPAIQHAPRVAEVVESLRALGLHPSPLPLGLIRPDEPGGCVLCRTCNSFPCFIHAKSEADVCCVRPALARPTVTLWTHSLVRRLLTDESGSSVTAAEIDRNGETVRVEAPLFIVACGAVNSAALMLRSTGRSHPQGLANSSGLVGRRYMAHLATMISAFDRRRVNDTVFQKTVAINDYYLAGNGSRYPLGQVQSQGRTQAVVLKAESPWYGRWIPLPAWEWWAAGAMDWLVMSEDLPLPDNRVTVDQHGRIHLRYRQSNAGSHRQLVERMQGVLKQIGFFTIKHSLGTRNTTHQCGTLCFGTDPKSSVLDPWCRAHDVSNLYVVDASFFPSSAAVNPGLTIIAQALRVADHIRKTL
ncbi:MAG: GMC family oxidoreductase [Vicinamibacterales bacterium]